MKSKYDYSLLRIDYPDHLPKSDDIIRVICPIHGEFRIRYDNHKYGQGCKFCNNHYWTKENCIIDAKKYKTRSEWQLNSGSAYKATFKNKWLDECCVHMLESKTGKKWDLDSCKEDAINYKTRYDWQLNSRSAYNSARRNKWLDECCVHMLESKTGKKWGLHSCKEDAMKYITRSEWKSNNYSAYNSARRNKWLDDCCKHMILLRKKIIEVVEV